MEKDEFAVVIERCVYIYFVWVMVYNFAEDEMTEYSFHDVVKSGLYHDLEIDFSQV